MLGQWRQQAKGHQKKQNQYWIKQISQNQKEVQINFKYKLTKESPYFQYIEMIVSMIQQKNKYEQKKYHSIFDISYYHTIQFALGKCKMEEQTCSICLQEYQIRDFQKQVAANEDIDILLLGCSHKYHKRCLLQLIGEKSWAKCPICMTIFGRMTGDQPQGKMTSNIDPKLICSGYHPGTIIITYNMYATQRNNKQVPGTTRVAYLPNTPQGQEVHQLLKEAFARKLIFTVGRSVTTGMDNQIVWNGIHHKTSTMGGVASFGYPDLTYFSRVKEELAAKGIK